MTSNSVYVIDKNKMILKTQYFLFRLYHKIKELVSHDIDYPTISNVNEASESSSSKRALMIYIIKPFLVEENDPSFFSHHKNIKCKLIALILGELGYIVDAVDIRDKQFKPSRDYDIVVSNKANLMGMEAHFTKNAKKIFLASVTNHIVHNRNLQKRHELLFERRKCKVKVRRIYAEAMPYVTKSDAVVSIGNEFIMSTWKEVFDGPTYSFNNCGFRGTGFPFDSKDFEMARKNFLFFASGSQVQKGLDLLLEIFPKHQSLHLYVCSPFKNERDFCACYRKELFETTNIHPVGWVRVNSPEFYDLARTCAYVIHPTCSEGQPGSVVQCMYAGLIPLVTKEAGIDTEDFGVPFSGDSLEEIERVIIEVSELKENWHREHSVRTRRIAEVKYSENALVEKWRGILTEILNSAEVAAK